VFIEAPAIRIECLEHGVHTAAVPWARHHSTFTRYFENTAAWMALYLPKNAVAEYMRISWNTVGPIISRFKADADPMPEHRFNNLKHIGIDETSYRKGHTKKKRGRHAHANQEETDIRRIGERECRASPEELAAYHRERICKKIKRLSSGTRRPRKQEIAQAITELRQELKCSLGFILETIQLNPELPQMTRSDYYYWSSDHTDKDEKNNGVMNKIIQIFYTHKRRYGYRRITLQLKNEGYTVNHKMVKRLMKRLGLFGISPKAKYKSYKGDLNGTVKSQLLNKVVDEEKHKTYYKRDFSTSTVNEKWTTDVSEFHIAAGKLYLSPIMDMDNREIVSYSISRSPNYAQTQEMLDKAFEKYPDLSGLILHSDQGWQYQMTQYHKALQNRGIIQSMSRKGNCLDNCIMENFFGKMKNEMFYGHEFEFKTLDELEKAMEEYIFYYNNERIQVRLKGLTPCQYRSQTLELNH
jgi:transposase InsO family protein